jgi:hypothetical protein
MSREDSENSEANYYDGILPPNQADKMIAKAEEGQVIKPLPKRHIVTDEELEADFLDRVNNSDTGSRQEESQR